MRARAMHSPSPQNSRCRGGHLGPSPLAICSLQCPHLCALASLQMPQLSPAAGTQLCKWAVLGNKAAPASSPRNVYLLCHLGMGMHTEGSEGPEHAGSQAGKRGWEAWERQESAPPGVWRVGCFPVWPHQPKLPGGHFHTGYKGAGVWPELSQVSPASQPPCWVAPPREDSPGRAGGLLCPPRIHW